MKSDGDRKMEIERHMKVQRKRESKLINTIYLFHLFIPSYFSCFKITVFHVRIYIYINTHTHIYTILYIPNHAEEIEKIKEK
mgnify:CR=1 FL=1